jgi:hypothetical protein
VNTKLLPQSTQVKVLSFMSGVSIAAPMLFALAGSLALVTPSTIGTAGTGLGMD